MSKVEIVVNDKKYIVRTPNDRVIREADSIESVEFTKCVDNDVKTKVQMKDLLKAKGIWTDAKENKEKEIVKEINRIELSLYKGDGSGKKTTIKEGVDKALKIKDLRDEYMALIRERQSYEANTAESIASNARFDYFVASCVFNENGTRVYKSYDDYQEKSSDDVAFKAAEALAKLLYSIEEDFAKKLPENVWLSRFGLVDDKLRLIDKKGKFLVDRDGKRVNELGHYIDDQGNRTDRDGNPLDADGNYTIEALYVDEDGNDVLPVVEEKKEETTDKQEEVPVED